MSKRLHILACVAPLAMVLAGSAGATSLKEAVEKAVSEHPSVAAAQASLRATEAVRYKTIGRFFPEITLRGEVREEIIDRPGAFGPDDNNEFRRANDIGVNIRQVLFDGFDRINDVYRSRARITAASHKILARSEAVALNGIEAYIDVVRHNRLISLGNANVQRHRDLLKLVQARVDGGKNTEGDLRQTRERLQAAIALVSQIRIARDTARAKYKAAVGEEARGLRRAPLPRLPFQSSASAVQTALSHNPRIAAMKAEIDAAGFRTDQARSSFYPLVTLEADGSRGDNLDGTEGRSDEFKAQLKFSWKVFDGLVQYRRVEELTEREYVKVAERDALLREITQEIEISWSRIIEGRVQVAAKSKQLDETEKVVAAYREEYEADRRSLLDVLDAENTRFAIEFELSNVRSIRAFAAYQILGHAGVLLDHLGVRRPDGGDRASGGVYSSSYSSPIKSFVIPPLK
ncbi:MAG: TolC family outer membrane protein [Rhizobiaceae bacterium]|nr:TolC family outer membrane protein [Rhizobiaceae bacterium]